MRFVVPALVGFGLLLAPAANAVSCGEANSLRDYVRDDFKYITGDAIARDRFEAIYTLRGATACRLELVYDSVYVCDWTFATEAAAASAFANQSASLAPCLAGWSRTGGATETIFDGMGEDKRLRWTVRLVKPAADGAVWRVAVSFAYVWSGRPG